MQPVRGIEEHNRLQAAKKSPVGSFLNVPVPTSRNVKKEVEAVLTRVKVQTDELMQGRNLPEQLHHWTILRR